MCTDVYIIENPQVSSAISLDLVLKSARLDVGHRTSWELFRPDQMCSRKPGLIVANAYPDSAGAQEFFGWLHQHSAGAPTFAILPADDAELIRIASTAVDDFLLWPVRGDELSHRLLRLLGPPTRSREEMQSALIGQLGLQQLIGEDPAFVDVLLQVSQFGSSDAAVLLSGETGTGKELCARAVHLLSRRRNGPFIPVECGSIPEHIFESEVFGHVRGAFTDARCEQKGLVALARGGTLFLDEIDSLSLGMQGKLLRLLQEQTFRPLGSEQFCRADLRVVAATNCDLAALVQQKRFRSDLFFRLDVLRVQLPALRERPKDVALLARHFVAEVCAKDGLARKTLTPAAIRKLEAHSWPGNVRELYNAIHRAALCAGGTEIVPIHITLGDEKAAKRNGRIAGEAECCSFKSGKRRAIESFEKDYILQLLEKFRGNMTRAAREAGKDRRAFGRLAKKYGLSHVPGRSLDLSAGVNPSN
jgi:DNA-binding NtrC family response regulator